jgi:hypothetical protein
MTPQKPGPLGSGSPNKTMKNIALVLLIVIMAALTYEVFQEQQGKVQEIHYSKFLDLVRSKRSSRLSKPAHHSGTPDNGALQERQERRAHISHRYTLPRR